MIDTKEKLERLPPTMQREGVGARLKFYKQDDGLISGGYFFPSEMNLGRDISYIEYDLDSVIDKLFNYLHG